MPLSLVDIVLGGAVLSLVGWALVQCGTKAPPKRGCGSGCGSGGCGTSHASGEGEQLVTLGAPPVDAPPER